MRKIRIADPKIISDTSRLTQTQTDITLQSRPLAGSERKCLQEGISGEGLEKRIPLSFFPIVESISTIRALAEDEEIVCVSQHPVSFEIPLGLSSSSSSTKANYAPAKDRSTIVRGSRRSSRFNRERAADGNDP